MRHLALLLLLVCWPAYAEPFAQFTVNETTKIILHSEDCRLTSVTNLPSRATWEEGGKVYEGCYGFDGRFKLIRLWFEDKTVIALPVQVFLKVTGV